MRTEIGNQIKLNQTPKDIIKKIAIKRMRTRLDKKNLIRLNEQGQNSKQNKLKEASNLTKIENQKNEYQTQNKYKLEDTIEFFKALHVYRGMRERKEGEEEKDQSSPSRRSDDNTRHPKRCVATFRVG